MSCTMSASAGKSSAALEWSKEAEHTHRVFTNLMFNVPLDSDDGEYQKVQAYGNEREVEQYLQITAVAITSSASVYGKRNDVRTQAKRMVYPILKGQGQER